LWLILRIHMKLAVVFICLLAGLLGGCSWFPGQGPSTNEVLEQRQAGNDILFDVVEVDDRVTAPGIEPLAPEAGPPASEPQGERGAPSPPNRRPPGLRRGQEVQQPSGTPFSIEAAAASGRRPALIPDQDVEADGAISVPYAGRIPAAGRLPTEVQQTIESRLARKALEPQALVIVKKTSGNTVTVAGEAGLAEGATAAERGTEMLMFPLAPGGDAQASKTGVLG
jgi:polysaccharide export outer membrane protein